mgnify:CR=1 FL=1
MTGDELTTLLLRHGVEVIGYDLRWSNGDPQPHYAVHCREIAAAALSPEMLPFNVELIINSERQRDRYGYLGTLGTDFRYETQRMEGCGNFLLTSSSPMTQLHGDVLSARRSSTPRSQQPTNVPSRRFIDPAPPTPPRRVNDAELLTRLQSHLEASPRRFHWFTDAELRTLGKSACTPPWQRLECVILDGVAPASIAALLPSNVFLQLGDVTTGLWGSREDEVFVETIGQQGDSVEAAQQGFRADLWRRICQNTMSREDLDSSDPRSLGNATSLENNLLRFAGGYHLRILPDRRSGFRSSDIATRWRVYQELKPLYDIVDGAMGSAPMPLDIESEWTRQLGQTETDGDWFIFRTNHGLFAAEGPERRNLNLLGNFNVILDAVANARVATATTSQPQQATPTISRWDVADLRRAISSDYEIVAVTPLRADPHLTPKDGRYRVDVRLADERGYRVVDLASLPRGISVYLLHDGGTNRSWSGENDSLVADLDGWTSEQPHQIGEVELRAVVLGLPNVLGISGRIERGSRQRDRYIVRVTLVDRDVPLDSALAPRIPGNVHVHCQGRGEGGMRGVRGTGAMLYVPQHNSDHIVDALTQTQQHLQRRVDYDGLVALLRRHLGDDARVTSIKAGREGHFDVEVTSIREYGIPWHEVPGNVTLTINGGIITGTSSQVFDPGRRVLVDKAPRYFDADGDTVTTPDKAPPWLHIICRGAGSRALWCRRGDDVHLDVVLPYGAVLGGPGGVIQTEEKLKAQLLHQQGVIGCVKVAPAPKVEPGIVAALRSGTKLDVIVASSAIWSKLSSDVAMRCLNVVDDIQYTACVGLDDVAAAERCNHYAVLLDEAKQQNISDVDEHVHRWCAQFQTRFALLEVDDADHTAKPRQPSAVLKRGKKPLTITTVMKFRELMASRMCPSTAEAAKQAGIDGEVAVYVLQRWCGGLGDEEALAVASSPQLGSSDKTTEAIDIIVEAMLHSRRPQLDVAAALPPSVLAVDEAAKKQRLVLAQVAEQLRQERQRRAAQVASQPVQELSRFALLDVDEAAPDPTTVTNAWHAQQAQRNQPAKKIVAPPPQVPFAPPSQQHIDVPTPPHNGVDYVDATMISPQLQDLVKVAGLVSAAEQSGLMKRVYEN